MAIKEPDIVITVYLPGTHAESWRDGEAMDVPNSVTHRLDSARDNCLWLDNGIEVRPHGGKSYRYLNLPIVIESTARVA
jgi:hypothetical protein